MTEDRWRAIADETDRLQRQMAELSKRLDIVDRRLDALEAREDRNEGAVAALRREFHKWFK